MPILGVVENMSYFQCPHCQCQSDIFPGSTGGAASLTSDMGVTLIARIPLDPTIAQASESGTALTSPHYDAIVRFINTAARK